MKQGRIEVDMNKRNEKTGKEIRKKIRALGE
jgi:hypothetical protein